MSELNTVTISASRYEELIDVETRVNVAVERIYHEHYMSIEDILWILGTSAAIAQAKELRKVYEESCKSSSEDSPNT